MPKRQVFAAVVLVMVCSAPAFAGSPTASNNNGTPTAVVRTHGLDLTNRKAQHRLRVRLATAIESVCGSYENASPEVQDRIELCRANAIADVSPKIAGLMAKYGPKDAGNSRNS